MFKINWLLRFFLIAQITAGAVLCGVLSIFLLLSLYTWPSSADDLCLANYFEEYGVFDGLYGKYMQWTGVYTSIFLIGAVPQLGDYYSFYRLLPLSIILLTVGVSTAFFRVLFLTSRPAVWHWVVGVAFTVLFLSSMPTVVSGFYWFSSAAKYQGGNIFLICLLLVFMRLVRSAHLPLHEKTKDYLFAGVCITLGVGFSETQMMMFYAVVTLMCFWRISVERGNARVNFVWLGLFVWLNCCAAISILAPGNFIRSEIESSVYTTSISMADAIHLSIALGIQGIKRYLSLPQIWWFSGLLVGIVLAVRSDKSSSDSEPTQVRGAYISLGLLFCLVFPVIFQFPSLKYLSVPPPLRTENIILFSFLLSWSITLVLFLHWILDKWPRIDRRVGSASKSIRLANSLLRTVLMLGFVGSVLAASNIQTAYVDVTKVAPAYSDFMSSRYQELLALKGSGASIIVSQYKNPPETIHSLDIVSIENGHDFSVCFAEYFGVDLKVIDDTGVIGEHSDSQSNTESAR